MTTSVLPLRHPHLVDEPVTLEQMQRSWLDLEEAARPWSDSVLIAMLATATPVERGAIIRQLAREGV